VQAYRVETKFGDHTLSLETGKLAKQAHGAVVVRMGDTLVLAAATEGPPIPDRDFFPLQMDYREKTYSAGKFPGGYIKREGRPTLKETLTSRLCDRPVRPLFPADYKNEVQVLMSTLSADRAHDPDILAMIGASAALHVSHVPFRMPTGAVRVGRVDGKLIAMPTYADMEESDLDLIVAATRDAVTMIEGFAREMPEEEMLEAIEFAHEACVKVIDLIEDLRKEAGLGAKQLPPAADAGPLAGKLKEFFYDELKKRKQVEGKINRKEAVTELVEKAVAEFAPEGGEFTKAQVKNGMYALEERVVRDLLLDGKRLDGRPMTALRNISCEVGLLPRTHGSALFQRGETQALVTATLGTVSDEQKVEGLAEEYSKKFMLDYNFPPFSVGECKPIRGPGRREMGHGALAERSLKAIIPGPDKFPYTIRLVSDILESNGSSSMASVCGGTLALMDAGVPIKQPVAGISIGLVKEARAFTLLTDIMGDEDHFGDMDFKIAGTQTGICGIQLDLKIDGIDREIIKATLEQARKARIEILRHMLRTITRPRGEISQHAPRLLTIKINPEKIGALIGPGGKNIKGIQEATGAKIDIEDDGTVYIAHSDTAGAEAARLRVEAITEEVKVGKTYEGRVSSIKEFGAFIEIIPGKDGLCHISELSDGYVERVDDVVKMGDVIRVKVISIDDQDRVKLSRKAVMREEAGLPPEEPRPREPRGDRSDRGDRGPPRGSDRGGPRGEHRREGGERGEFRPEPADRPRDDGDRPRDDGGDRPRDDGGDRPRGERRGGGGGRRREPARRDDNR
jgi:polyribonucleotide nucleotidyltransferase